jgi:hypothetical protein
MFDLSTILKAIDLVGDASEAARQIYEGFIAVTRGETQDELKARYAKLREQSDAAHQSLQEELRR